jgi:hypothetical protein
MKLDNLLIFTFSVHYAYGNIHFLQKNWTSALRDYEACLKIGLATMPIHPITAAAYYSIACVEFELGNVDSAKSGSPSLTCDNNCAYP